MNNELLPYQRQAVRLALTEFLARHTGDRHSQVLWLNAMLRSLSPISVEPPGKNGGWGGGRSVLSNLGMTADELDDLCLIARANGRLLDDQILCEAVIDPLWYSAWRLIQDGPLRSWGRYEPILRLWARGLEADGTARPRGRLSKGSIHIASSIFASFGLALDELRKHELEDRDDELGLRALGARETVFTKWSRSDFPTRPSAEALGAAPANTDTSAPPFRYVRLILLGLNWEIEQRRSSSEGQDLMFRPQRDRALLTLALLGARCSALARMRTPIENHTWPDGITTPAVDLNPRKGKPRVLFRPKALDRQAFDWVTEYATYAGIKDGEVILLAARGRPYSSGKRVSNRIAEILRMPLNPKLHANPYFRAAASMWPKRRISAHPIRHLVEEVAFEVGLDDEMANRGQLVNWDGLSERNVRVPAQVYPDALLDHEMRRVGDIYKDAASERGRQIYGRKAGLGVYEYFLTERGARKVPDSARVQTTSDALKRAVADRDALLNRIESIEDEVLGVNFRDLSDAERERLTAEHTQTTVLLGRLARQVAEVGETIAEAKAELAKAKQAVVPLADLAPVPELQEDESDCVEEGVPVVRDYAWSFEFRWAVGEGRLAESTLRRWMCGHLPHPPGDRRNLIEVDAVEVLSERVRRIRLDRLDWSRFPLDVQERLEVIRRTPDPGRRKRRDAGRKRSDGSKANQTPKTAALLPSALLAKATDATSASSAGMPGGAHT